MPGLTILLLNDRQEVKSQENDDKLRSQVETTNQPNITGIIQIHRLCCLANAKEKGYVE